MLKNLLNYLENKEIVILGFGKQGISTYNFLRKHFPTKRIDIMDEDMNLFELHPELDEDIDCEVILGKLNLDILEKYDLIIKSPGISLKNYNIDKIKNKITTQYELFLEYIDVFSIGVTGTKGKSTTSSLIKKVLDDNNKKAILLENIGNPIFDSLEVLDNETIVVLEVSSHILEFAKKSPNIALILNIYQEHLDYYKSFEDYIIAKFNIVKFQSNEDFCIYNIENEFMNKFNFTYKSNDLAVSLYKTSNSNIYIENGFIYFNNEEVMNVRANMNLKGEHNLNNIMFVIGVAKILNLNMQKTIDAICDFEPLEHRLEYVGKFNDIEFYNDSIATIPEATINGINALKNVNTIIIGGNDRGVNLDKLIEFLIDSCVENIICIHTTRKTNI